MKRTAVMAAVLLIGGSGMAKAIGLDVRRVTPANRPYIIELGEPRAIGPIALQQERALNSDLRDYLDLYGRPDYAEVQHVVAEYPWYPYEVRLYYLDRNQELAFGRAFISPDVRNLGVIKYLGLMDAGTRDRVVALASPPRIAPDDAEPVEIRRAKPAEVSEAAPPEVVAAAEPPPSGAEAPDEFELLVRRVEAAADRALVAADQAETASNAASAAADRTVTVLEKLAQ